MNQEIHNLISDLLAREVFILRSEVKSLDLQLDDAVKSMKEMQHHDEFLHKVIEKSWERVPEDLKAEYNHRFVF